MFAAACVACLSLSFSIATPQTFSHCSPDTGVIVEQLLTSEKWSADPAKSWEFTSDGGQPATWDGNEKRAWHVSQSGEGYMHFYGEQSFYYPDMVNVAGDTITLGATFLNATTHAADEVIYASGRGLNSLRNTRFASGRIEWAPDALAMSGTRHGAVMMEAAVPYNNGAWPAFWLMPMYSGYDRNHSWATGMEVDIMEMWKGPQPTSNVMYNAVQEKTESCGDAGEPPCTGIYTDAPRGAVGLGTDPWDGVCPGCREGLPFSPQVRPSDPDVYHGYGFEWDVDLAEDGDVANATLSFSHVAEEGQGLAFTDTFELRVARTGEGADQRYSAEARVLGGPWTDPSELTGAWWTDPGRDGIGGNYVWDFGFSLWQAWNVAYRGGMYMIANLAVGGDGHCGGQAYLDREHRTEYADDLLTCEGSGWGREFDSMSFRVRSTKFFNFDGASAEYQSGATALGRCLTEGGLGGFNGVDDGIISAAAGYTMPVFALIAALAQSLRWA